LLFLLIPSKLKYLCGPYLPIFLVLSNFNMGLECYIIDIRG